MCYNPLARVVTTPPWVVTTTLVVTTPVIMGCNLSVCISTDNAGPFPESFAHRYIYLTVYVDHHTSFIKHLAESLIRK